MGQSTQTIRIENYNCNAVALGPINQSHLTCSPKVLATVVCALRRIVRICTTNNSSHHSLNANSWPPSCSPWWRLEDTIILISSSSVYSKRFLVLSILGNFETRKTWWENRNEIHLEPRLEESENERKDNEVSLIDQTFWQSTKYGIKLPVWM